MIRMQHFLTAGVLTAGLLLPAGLLAGAEKSAAKGAAKGQSTTRAVGAASRRNRRPRNPSGN